MSQNKMMQTTSSTDIIQNPTSEPAYKNKNLMANIIPAMNLKTDGEKEIFMKAMEKFRVTEIEVNEAFWKAYADPYTPNTGIEFKHIWKHVKEDREYPVIDGGTWND